LIQVYTGNGKGKTTAAWGLALRAVGHGLKVAVVQFLKPPISGERLAGARLSPQLAVFGETRPYNPNLDQRESPELRADSRSNFELAVSLTRSKNWDVLILDEINVVLHYGFVSQCEMLDLLNSAPNDMEIVCTGRSAPEWLIKIADLVTEMNCIKHPYEIGTPARRGIDY
jgi:cob(I)alamin adenosyltransferase